MNSAYTLLPTVIRAWWGFLLARTGNARSHSQHRSIQLGHGCCTADEWARHRASAHSLVPTYFPFTPVVSKRTSRPLPSHQQVSAGEARHNVSNAARALNGDNSSTLIG